MTTDQRRKFYGPAWRPAFAACWLADRGTILARPGRPSALPDSGLPRPEDVEAIAALFAAREGRALKEHDLRRACRLLALGRDVPDGNTLGNTDEVERVVTCFALLADPERLDAIQDWQDPARAASRRIIRGLERCGVPEAMLRAWCAHFHAGEHEWRSLDGAKLKGFSRYVWGRIWKRGGARRRTTNLEGRKAGR